MHEGSKYTNTHTDRCAIYLTFTFTFGEDSVLSSAKAVISFSPMRSAEITKRLYKSL